MKYLKVWTNFRDVIQYLKDEEKGRLFDAMLAYADTGEEPDSFIGSEKVIWPVAKRDIDMASEWRETCRANGLKGGRPKTKENPMKPNETHENPIEPKETLKEKKRNENKGNEISFLDDDEAKAIQGDHDRLLNAAEDAGFKMSNSVRASLIRLYSENGIEKVLTGLDECMRHGAANLAYLEAVLKGTGKRKPAVKVLPAQQYDQRDYSAVQADLMAEQDREMQEYMARQIG